MSGTLRIVAPEWIGLDPAHEVALDAENAHYLLRVRRARPGEAIELVPGDGRRYRGLLELEGRSARLVEVVADPPLAPPAQPDIELWAALVKPTRWEWLVEKAAELGAACLRPLTTLHTQTRIPAARAARKVERWQQIADGAVRQCGRLHRMEVHTPLALDALLHARGDLVPGFADESRAGRWEVAPELLNAPRVALLIGPEGGFAEEEREQIRAAGAAPIRLGETVLRSETAACAGLALLMSSRQRARG